MKNFGTTFLACLLAMVAGSIVSVVISVIFFVSIAAASFDTPAVIVEDNSILKISLDDPIIDKPSGNPMDNFDIQSLSMSSNYSLLSVLNTIEKAKEDDKIKGIYLNLSTSLGGTSLAIAEELRAALIDFKTSGKFIVSFADMYSQGSYYLSSVADDIYINPVGDLSWQGMASQVMFFRGTLDKLGVEPVIIRHGKFKSAVEPFMVETMSEANRAQYDKLLGSIWGNRVKEISIQRGIDSTLLQQYASELTIESPEDAMAKSMVDSLLYMDQVMANLKQRSGTTKDEPQFVSLSDYITVAKANPAKKLSKNKVAVIYASGSIVDNGSQDKEIVGNDMAKNIAKAREDSTVKAIVFRVNSPGGSALASDVIWREVTLAMKDKPVIVSMGEYAASGGYYISCPADMILANASTLTGSIGVFGLYFNVGKAAKDKLGVNVDVVSTNPSADMGSMFRSPTQAELDFAQKSVERVYSTFIGHVAEGRNMTTEAVDEIGQGRVWSGLDAQKIGLVDGIGGLKDAIAIAASKAGLGDDYRVTTISGDDNNPFSALMKMFGGSASVESQILSAYKSEYEYVLSLVKHQGVQAILPYKIVIK